MANYLTLLLQFTLTFGYSFAFDYPQKALQDTYDFVVVGGGSAGAVVANRLSENEKFSVLLLDAGGPPPAITEVPLFADQIRNTPLDWRGKMEPQDNSCQENPDGVCWWTRVRGLGGCSSHNFMCYNRGNKKDFDYWEELGAKGWKYSDVLETFKLVENNTDFNINGNGYHGTSGYITVSPLAYKTKVGKALFEGGEELGIKINEDYNGESQEGFSYIQASQRDGKRCSTEKAFLRPAAERENLQILTHAYVLKIYFDNEKRVKSVIFDHENKTKEVYVSKEVVLSAGAISSPTILMLSGIGPKEHLAEMKIPMVADLPGVGQNLQDHPALYFMNFELNDTVGIVYNRDVNPENIGLYGEGKGPLTSPANMEILGFINTKYQNKSEEWPDILFHTGMAVIFPVQGTSFRDKNSTGFLMIILRPKSRGFIQLRSSDPHEDPIVDPKYFSDVDDLNRLVEGVRFVFSLMKTAALQKYNPEITPKVLPGCDKFDPESDSYLECAVRKYLIGGFHLAGSCRMGDPNEITTVVDPQLRVIGVQGLRVADASIMPTITSSNLNAPCIMIGRKAADMILSEN